MSAEHWYDFGSLAGNRDLFAQVIAHIAAAAVPNPVLQYLKAGQITPLAKPTVKRTSPDTENHDKNGYAKLYDDNNIFMTNVDNDNSDTTYTNMRNM